MTLKEKLLNLEAELLGNRVSALSTALFASGVTTVLVNGLESAGLLAGLSLEAGIAGMSYTTCGTSTSKIYKRTKEHLRNFGKLDSRFFDTMVGFDKEGILAGYCQLQGMYLACRDYAPELLSEFYKLKKENTRNILPNF